MNKIILYESLKLIKSEEWKDFEKFADSPYFNKGRNYLPLIRLLKTYHPDFYNEKLTKEYIYKKLFPGKSYNDNALNVMFSGLNSLCEEFLIQLNLNSKEFEKRIMLIAELNIRNSTDRSGKLIAAAEKSLKDSKLDYSKFRFNSLLNGEKRRYLSILEKHKECMECQNEFIKFGLYDLMTNIFDFLIHEYSLKPFIKKVDMGYIKELTNAFRLDNYLKLIKENDHGNYPLILATYLAQKALCELDNDSYFYELMDFVENNAKLLSRECYLFLISDLYDISIMKLSLGKTEFDEIQFNLVNKIVDENYFQVFGGGKYIPLMFFRNLLKLNVGRNPGRVEYFIEKHINKFEPNKRDIISNYSKANIFFERGKFDEAMLFNNSYNTDMKIFIIDQKILTLKIYFEKKMFDAIFPVIDTLNHYIKNNLGQEVRIVRYKKFLGYLKSLIRAEEKNSFDELELLKKRAEQDNFSDIRWLVEKIDEFMKSSIPRKK